MNLHDAEDLPTDESALRTPGVVPSLAELIRAGRASAEKIKRASREALIEWFAQSERLNIARNHYKLRGGRFLDFAKRLGVDRSSAFELVKLFPYRAEIMRTCADQQETAATRNEVYSFPGWRTALSWVHDGKAVGNAVLWRHDSDEWETPTPFFEFWNSLFHFDVDVAATERNTKCKIYFTKAHNGLAQTWKSGQTYWMNAPYSQAEKWAKKASEAAISGAVVVGLFANRSGSKWYQNHVVPNALVVQLSGRITFVGGDYPAPFPSIIVIWPKEAGNRILEFCVPTSTVLLTAPIKERNPQQKR